jgi:hypothetical protein
MWISEGMFESFLQMKANDYHLHRSTPLNYPYKHCNHSQNQQNVDEAAESVRADHTQQPQNQEQDSNRPEHS